MIKVFQQLRPPDPKCQHVLSQRDARIHFVISAGTRSDPPIRILDGENVQEELHHATFEFLSYTVKVDMDKRCVTLPRIFYWYAEDFPTPEKSLLLWVAKYLPVETAHQLVALVESSEAIPSVSYENFDWSNAEARFNAAVVRRKRRKLERERSLIGEELNQALQFDFHMPADDRLDPFLSNSSIPALNLPLHTNGDDNLRGEPKSSTVEHNSPAKPESDASNRSQEGASRGKNGEEVSDEGGASQGRRTEAVQSNDNPESDSPKQTANTPTTNN